MLCLVHLQKRAGDVTRDARYWITSTSVDMKTVSIYTLLKLFAQPKILPRMLFTLRKVVKLKLPTQFYNHYRISANLDFPKNGRWRLLHHFLRKVPLRILEITSWYSSYLLFLNYQRYLCLTASMNLLFFMTCSFLDSPASDQNPQVREIALYLFILCLLSQTS